MQKDIEKLEFVPGANFEFIDSLRNNGLKNFVNLWRFMWRDLQFKIFVDIVIAGRHHGLSTIYIKHNLFHQSKHRRDVELQNTHIVLIKSPRDMMQVSTLSAHLGLGSKLVDWYQDAPSVPYGHLLIDLSPRTDDKLRHCTNTGSIPSKLFIPDRLKQSKILDDEHTKTLYSPSVPLNFQQMQKLFPSGLPRSNYQVHLRLYSKNSHWKPARHKKTPPDKFSKQRLTIVFKTYNLEAKNWHSGVRKCLQLNKVITPPVISPLVLIWSSLSSFLLLCTTNVCYPVTYKAGTYKVSTLTKFHVPNWLT